MPMLNKLPRVRQGAPITADLFNRVMEAIESTTIVSALGARLKKTRSGTTLTVDNFGGRRGGGSSAELRPLELVPVTLTNGSLALRVVVSTIGGVVPTGFSALDLLPFLLTPEAGTLSVYGQVTIDDDAPDAGGGEVTDSAVIQSLTTPEDTDTLKHFLFGAYTFTAAVGETPASLTAINYAYGPLLVDICYAHFTSPPAYDVNWRASG